MAVENIAGIKLTRTQIREIVGDDLAKIKVFEALMNSAVIQDKVVDDIRVAKWGNGKMEMYPESPTSSAGGTVTFPETFYVKPNITAGENFTISALSQTAFTWTSTITTEHMWRAVGRWKE